VLKLVCPQRSFFYFAGNERIGLTGDQCVRADARGGIHGDFIIIPNTNVNRDRFCGNAMAPVISEFKVWWWVISKL